MLAQVTLDDSSTPTQSYRRPVEGDAISELTQVGALAQSLYVDGTWLTSADCIPVIDPTRGAEYGLAGAASADEANEAIAAADRALPPWERTSGGERAAVLESVARLLHERSSLIAQILCRETGKLRSEAEAELHFSAEYFSWFAGEARRLQPVRRFAGAKGREQMVLRSPVGLAALLTPWNFPVSIQARKLAAALAAGCTVVSRPSIEAPLSVVELFRCLEGAGLPGGVANLVTGRAEELTEPILADRRVRVLSFTGSTPVGKRLYAGAATTLKRILMELGGAAPFIVCSDADLDHTLEQAMVAKFRNCGQSCIAANTFFVADSLYEAFVDGLADRISRLALGDPWSDSTSLGPVINEKRRSRLECFVDTALASGFAHVTSAPPLSPRDQELGGGYFFPPQLLTARSWESIPRAFFDGEVFGPIAVVTGYSDLKGLIASLRQSPYGLAGYVFSGDPATGLRIATELEVGMVGVNEGVASAVNIPMGGVKDSGFGREGGDSGMLEYMDVQSISLGAKTAGDQETYA